MGDEEQAARNWLESVRWPTGPVCMHCGNAEVIYRLRTRPGTGTRHGLWKCGRCRKQFTVTVDTILEETRLALSQWLRAIRLECGTPGGTTARQMAALLGITAKTARAILKKIRYAVAESLPAAPSRNSILGTGAHQGKAGLYPLSFEASVGLLLSVRPVRKHPDALARRLSELEAVRPKREAAKRQR